MRVKKILLAELLVENRLLTTSQLQNALEVQKKSDRKIGQILVDLGYIEEEKLLEFLSKQLEIPYIHLHKYPLQTELIRKLPEFYARHYRAIILKEENRQYLIGMADPQDLLARDEIERVLQTKISLALVKEDEVLKIIDKTYRRSEEITSLAEALSEELEPTNIDKLAEQPDLSSEDIPVVKLLRSVFEDAVQVNASDIHIEPGESILRLRLRVDGVLQEQILQEKEIAQALIQRIKLMAGLNIAEKRLPQDGRFSIKIRNMHFDIRISTIPTQFGESLVMRLLNQSAGIIELDKISMPATILNEFKHLIQCPNGLILIVGPTGSGKTTTLYAALNHLNSPENKIITVEDPVEYRLPRINQVQTQPAIGLTFSKILRSILRQDPDIIMIGELRDQETAEIAIRAAMTGHMVLATLHTNDSIGSAIRLLDMGLPGYLIASVLRGVVAQRLVRRICTNCMEDHTPTSTELPWLEALQSEKSSFTFKVGKGCHHCHYTGYQGRAGLFELLVLGEELTHALQQNNTVEFAQLATRQSLYRSLLDSGLDLARQGTTSLAEVMRMMGEL